LSAAKTQIATVATARATAKIRVWKAFFIHIPLLTCTSSTKSANFCNEQLTALFRTTGYRKS
jgi:hypothetical protein